MSPLVGNEQVGYCQGEVGEVPVRQVISPKGLVIRVFGSCIDGTCKCEYSLDGVLSQLKPCRFAAIISNGMNNWARDYYDVLWGVTEGFDIVDGDVPTYECSNYSSILIDGPKEQMDDIVKKELAEGMISEVDYIPHCIHALGAVPKPGGKIRPITDCSRPFSKSVNNYCGSLYDEFSYKSVEDVIAMLETDEFMSVVDIKSAYRAVPISPHHRKFMGFRWVLDGRERTFVDNRMSFGLRLGPLYFDKVSRFIHDTLSIIYGIRVVNYLDDFLVVSSTYSGAVRDQAIVIGLLRYLGFHVSFEKVLSPSTCTTYLGIEIDSEKMELRLPAGKLVKLRVLLQSTLSKKKISKFDLESLGGLLSHCAHVVRGGKIFCRRVYQLYKTLICQGKKSIRLSAEVKADVKWWLSFCEAFNGVAKINNVMFEHAMISDASMKGFGVYLGSDWLAGTWEETQLFDDHPLGDHIAIPPAYVLEEFCTNINVLELWPIVLGLKRWANMLRNKTLLLFTDNMQVLYMLTSGKSSNTVCMSWVREIFWICIIHNIDIEPRYINTHCNLVADTLSRLSYFSTQERVRAKLGGTDLCCMESLFGCFRSHRGRIEG